jgi:S1-C subfamily serine protease
MNILRQQSIMFDGKSYLRNVGNVVTIDATQYGEVWFEGRTVPVKKLPQEHRWTPYEEIQPRLNLVGKAAVKFFPLFLMWTVGLSAADIIRTGTGFAASPEGHIVTNAHVVSGCSSVIAKVEGAEFPAQTVSIDDGNDIALLKMRRTFSNVPQFRVGLGVQLGESVTAFGYPLQGVLSTSLNMTMGNVSSLAGLSGDTRSFQFTAPIQPGNSGGPVVDASGNIVGIASSKLSPLWTARNTGDLPQNVNFAMRVSIVRDFLETRGVTPQTKALSAIIPATELAAVFAGVTIPLRCVGDQQSTELPAAPQAVQPSIEKRPGVLVAGFGAPAEFFQAVFLDIQNTLAMLGVRVANRSSAIRPTSDDSVAVPSLLELVRRQGSDSLLYITVERSGMNIRRVRLKCFDPEGSLQWEENASNARLLFGNEESSARYVMKQLKKKLEARAGMPGLPLR